MDNLIAMYYEVMDHNAHESTMKCLQMLIVTLDKKMRKKSEEKKLLVRLDSIVLGAREGRMEKHRTFCSLSVKLRSYQMGRGQYYVVEQKWIEMI